MKNLILSLFTGAGLLDRGFKQAGFCVVSAGDILWGHDVRDFVPASNGFEGVIGGPPCQDFSRARRTAPTGAGDSAIAEFCRVVTQCRPVWYLMENVPGVPTIILPGYESQRFNINAREVGCQQNRLRCFQWGSCDGSMLVLPRLLTVSSIPQKCCLASEGKCQNRRTWHDFCKLQGLPDGFDLPGLSLALKYKLVGNGVPVPLAKFLAVGIKNRSFYALTKVCACQCGRPVTDRAYLATAACRQRMKRRRDMSRDSHGGVVTSKDA